MVQRLQIKLLEGWCQATQDGPITYLRGSSSGALQFSFAQPRPDVVINVTEQTLIGLGEKLTAKVEGRREVLRQTGVCAFGKFATLAVKGKHPRHFQVWVLSNGREFILVTHIDGENEPGDTEIAEATEIALKTTLE